MLKAGIGLIPVSGCTEHYVGAHLIENDGSNAIKSTTSAGGTAPDIRTTWDSTRSQPAEKGNGSSGAKPLAFEQRDASGPGI